MHETKRIFRIDPPFSLWWTRPSIPDETRITSLAEFLLAHALVPASLSRIDTLPSTKKWVTLKESCVSYLTITQRHEVREEKKIFDSRLGYGFTRDKKANSFFLSRSNGIPVAPIILISVINSV